MLHHQLKRGERVPLSVMKAVVGQAVRQSTGNGLTAPWHTHPAYLKQPESEAYSPLPPPHHLAR